MNRMWAFSHVSRTSIHLTSAVLLNPYYAENEQIDNLEKLSSNNFSYISVLYQLIECDNKLSRTHPADFHHKTYGEISQSSSSLISLMLMFQTDTYCIVWYGDMGWSQHMSPPHQALARLQAWCGDMCWDEPISPSQRYMHIIDWHVQF